MSSHSLPSWRQPRQKRFVRFATVVPSVSIRVTPAWWQIYPGRVGRCGSNCMHDAHKGKARSFKSVEPELATMVNPEEVKKKRPPTALQIAHWMTFKEEQRLEWQQSYLTQLCEQDAQIAQTYELIQAFTSMLREREGERLDEWLERVEKQGVVELQSFAEATQEGL